MLDGITPEAKMQQGAFAIANAQTLRWTRQPTTAQSRHPPGSRMQRIFY